mgnify:CR=1 FL=1
MAEFDVCALGELLIDFTENGISENGNPIMEANPGGAPCNVLAMLNKQGYKTAFIGKVGNDIFGRQLKAVVREAGINTDGLVTDESVNTTLAFVHTLPGGDREFSFYRNPGADMMLSESDIDYKLVQNSRIFHFGSLSMTGEICEAATKKAVETAKESERGIVDIETRQATNQSLISTLDEVLKIQEEGRERRRSAEVELQKIEGEMRDKLLELSAKKTS